MAGLFHCLAVPNNYAIYFLLLSSYMYLVTIMVTAWSGKVNFKKWKYSIHYQLQLIHAGAQFSNGVGDQQLGFFQRIVIFQVFILELYYIKIIIPLLYMVEANSFFYVLLWIICWLPIKIIKRIPHPMNGTNITALYHSLICYYSLYCASNPGPVKCQRPDIFVSTDG